MGKRGPKLKLLASEVESKILMALSWGAFREAAANYAGVSSRTFRAWLTEGRRAKDPESPYKKFFRSVKEAEAKAEMRVSKNVFAAASTDPDIGLRWLSIRHRKRWNPKHQVELSGEVKHSGGDLDLKLLDDKELEQLHELTLKAQRRKDSEDTAQAGEPH